MAFCPCRSHTPVQTHQLISSNLRLIVAKLAQVILKFLAEVDISENINKNVCPNVVRICPRYSRKFPRKKQNNWISFQWEFQDPKMEVLYHIRPYFVGIFLYIGLIYGGYLQIEICAGFWHTGLQIHCFDHLEGVDQEKWAGRESEEDTKDFCTFLEMHFSKNRELWCWVIFALPPFFQKVEYHIFWGI